MNVTEQRTPNARFSEALASVGGQAHLVPDAAAAREYVAELVGDQPVVADTDPLLGSTVPDLRRVADPWHAEVGITTAVVACAETGTLALAFDRNHARSTSLVPPCHIAVLETSRLVDSYVELIGRMAALSPIPSGIQLITGPSGSADIEMIHIQGMHGPTDVHVVLVAENSQGLT